MPEQLVAPNGKKLHPLGRYVSSSYSFILEHPQLAFEPAIPCEDHCAGGIHSNGEFIFHGRRHSRSPNDSRSPNAGIDPFPLPSDFLFNCGAKCDWDGAFIVNHGTRCAAIHDGRSNTLAVAEVKAYQPDIRNTNSPASTPPAIPADSIGLAFTWNTWWQVIRGPLLNNNPYQRVLTDTRSDQFTLRVKQ